MVKVYDKNDNEVEYGEIIKENKTSFKIHSSSIIFEKVKYTYTKVL